MSEWTLFGLTETGWVVWFFMMSFWTGIQVLVNVARVARDRQ